ncbi:MAG TPA: acyltransferase [Flavipsychrobacter sp.]|nr:acyltransferase [Flavipsychrobacter sp.]
MEYYKELDGLRGIAVVLAAFTHWLFFPFFLKLGLGVWALNLFFVISGFLITEILLRQIYRKDSSKKILKNFYIKRILRIFPIYYLVVFLAYFFDIDHGRDIFWYLFTYTLNIYNVVTGDIGHAYPHLWSLCVEEQFYLLWPLLLLVVKVRHHKQLIIAVISLAVLYRFFNVILDVKNYGEANYKLMPSCMDALGLGALFAYLKRNNIDALKKILQKKYVPIICAMVCFAIVFSPVSNIVFQETFKRLLMSVCSFYIIGMCIFYNQNAFCTFLKTQVIQYLGKISYGIYLYHLIISTVLKYWLGDAIRSLFPHSAFLQYNTFVLEAPIYFLLTVSAATLSYYLIEINFLKLKAKAENRWQQKSILQSSAVVELPNDMQNISQTRDN